MREPIHFFVHGDAKPAGSKRGFCLKKGGAYTGRVVITDDCKTSRDWKTDVSFAARQIYTGPLWDGPIALRMEIIVRRPRCHYRSGKNSHLLKDDAPEYPIKKPDVLKLARGVEDALTAIIWQDDAQITSELLLKRFGDKPGVHILVREEAR